MSDREVDKKTLSFEAFQRPRSSAPASFAHKPRSDPDSPLDQKSSLRGAAKAEGPPLLMGPNASDFSLCRRSARGKTGARFWTIPEQLPAPYEQRQIHQKRQSQHPCSASASVVPPQCVTQGTIRTGQGARDQQAISEPIKTATYEEGG